MTPGSALVAGHICLDILPQFESATPFDFYKQFQPGSLIRVGPASFSTGGPVSNTGLSLYKLGIPTTLAARIGADAFGEAVRSIVAGYDTQLAQGIAAIPGETTSYTVIVSPPGIDRLFIHCPGANDTFSADDVDTDQLLRADLLHFGYPPVMRRMYLEYGAELERLFRRAKEAGATSSLDLCAVDPATEAGRLDWHAILRRTLPFVDVFTPSLDELLFMLDRPAFEQSAAQGGVRSWLLEDPGRLTAIGDRLLEMGARMVLIKLGDLGAYLRTADETRLAGMGRAKPSNLQGWAGRELWAPCFRVQVAGTTGSGDSTIAGFISALLRRLEPEVALTTAVAVGAFNVEAADALSGVPDWAAVQQRIAAGWERLKPAGEIAGWRWSAGAGLWTGPNDSRERSCENQKTV